MEGLRIFSVLIFYLSVAYAVTCPDQQTNWDLNVFLQHEDCHKFYKCVFGRAFEMSCPGGLYFNLETSQCDWKENVDCGNDTSQESNEGDKSEYLENGCPVDVSRHWLLPHENDCNLYYICISGRKLTRSCPGPLHFNFKLQICDWPKPEGCANTSDEDSSSENSTSENNSSKEDSTIEDKTKEDISKEDVTREDLSSENNSSEDNSSKEDSTIEDDTKEDISKEDGTTEDFSKEDSSSENNSSENNSSKENITDEDVSQEDISKEDTDKNDTDEDYTKESNSKEDISEEGFSKEDDSSKDDTFEEDTPANSRNVKKIEAIVDVDLLKKEI